MTEQKRRPREQRHQSPQQSAPAFAVAPDRCIQCGACALVAPTVFRMSERGSEVYAQPAGGEELEGARAALLICPTSAIRARGGNADAGAPAPAPPASATSPLPGPLFPRLARHSEQVRWRLGDLCWEQIDGRLATPPLRTLVREMAFSEHATYSATERFMQSFGDDVDFTQWLSVWFYEETRHPHALMQWLAAVGEPLDETFVQRGRVSTPFMKSKIGTLVTNIISEVMAASAYAAMGRSCAEPTLAALASSIAGDEARHAASFYLFARRRVRAAAHPQRERLDALKVLHFWLNETAQVSHPINQMLERLDPAGPAGEALHSVAFDVTAAQRRITRLIALVVEVPLPAPAAVLPALKELTASVHQHRREAHDAAGQAAPGDAALLPVTATSPAAADAAPGAASPGET